MKTKLTPLQKAIKKLLVDNDEGEILNALIEEISDPDYITGKMVDHLNMEGYNVVKIETLSDQITFEEKVKSIYPYMNEQQSNLHLSY